MVVELVIFMFTVLSPFQMSKLAIMPLAREAKNAGTASDSYKHLSVGYPWCAALGIERTQ